jgi:hypothetical protein
MLFHTLHWEVILIVVGKAFIVSRQNDAQRDPTLLTDLSFAECKELHPNSKRALVGPELRDEALFKDPPPKEDCPICFLPMPRHLISCVPLPPATISTIPIFDFVRDHQELTGKAMEQYYPCCGKSICQTTWTTRNLSSSVTISNFYAVIVNVFCFNIRRGIENSTTLND